MPHDISEKIAWWGDRRRTRTALRRSLPADSACVRARGGRAELERAARDAIVLNLDAGAAGIAAIAQREQGALARSAPTIYRDVKAVLHLRRVDGIKRLLNAIEGISLECLGATVGNHQLRPEAV